MALNRKPILDALLARLQTIPGLVTTSLKARMWTDLQPSDQPALFLDLVEQLADSQPASPTKWTLSIDVVVYVNESTDNGPTDTMLGLIDAIEAKLERQPDEVGPGFHTNLGGLVHTVRINGAINTDLGAFGPQAVAIIPLEVLVFNR